MLSERSSEPAAKLCPGAAGQAKDSSCEGDKGKNHPGSRKIPDRKINTMNLTERLTWVRWTEVVSADEPQSLTSKIYEKGSDCVPTSRAQALHGDVPAGVGAKALPHHSKAPAAGKRSAWQLRLPGFLWEMRRDEPLLSPLSRAQMLQTCFYTRRRAFPLLPAASWVSVVNSFHLRLRLRADL